MSAVDILIVGAGPAGLRAAEILAAAGREVLVLERHAEVGPKTCGGGLSIHSSREVEAMSFPAEVGRRQGAAVSFIGEEPVALEDDQAVVRTVARRVLGQFMLDRAIRAGAVVRTEAPASELDLATHTLSVHRTTCRYRTLIGADGSNSIVRRALGLPTPRELFAGEFNIPGLRRDDLLVAADGAALGSGYFWIFPHADYTSIGAVAPKHLIRPDTIRPYVEACCRELGIALGATPFEGATIEIAPVPLRPAEDVYLVGDAAGLASGLTAEGIFPALISGEAAAWRILEPGAPAPKLEAWLRTKRRHDILMRLGHWRLPRAALLGALAWTLRASAGRRLVTRVLVGG